MGRFQLESIYLYFPSSSQQAGTTVENKGKLILIKKLYLKSFNQLTLSFKLTFEENINIDLIDTGVTTKANV